MTDDTNRTRIATAAAGGTLLAVGLKRRSLGGAVAALAGGWLCYRGLTGAREQRAEGGEPTTVERSITVGVDADELYDRARDPETMGRLVGGFAEVSPVDEDRHRWTVQAPLGRELSWETVIVEDRPAEYLRWESEDAPWLSMEGSIRFEPAPGDRGTEVVLTERVDPPGGRAGDAALSALGVVPETLASKVLHRFKSLAETGEIPTLERNPSARGSGDLV